MRRSVWIILAIVLVTTITLIPPGAALSNRTTLLMTVWGMPFEDMLFEEGYARGFEAEHAGAIEVDYERFGSDLTQKYYAWNLRGESADVMRVRITDYHALVEKGVLLPLNEFIRHPKYGLTDDEIADYFPAIWRQLEIDETWYALPSDNAQYGLYYNKRIFDDYNAAHPETPLAYPDASWGWNDLARAAESLTQRSEDGTIEQFGIGFDLWAWPFMAFLHQAGGRLWDDAGTTTLIASDEGVAALEFLVSLIPSDAPIRSPELADSATGPATLFALDRQAMLLDGSWRAPSLEKTNPDLEYAVAPLPMGEDRAVISGSVLWAVGAHTEHPLWAWRMIKWMTSEEQSLRYWDTLRVAPPARVSVVQGPGFRSTSGLVDDGGQVRVPPMRAAQFADRAEWIVFGMTPNPTTDRAPAFVPVGVYQADLESKITGALVAAVRGAKSPRRALEDAARDMHAVIDRDRAAKGLPPVDR
ncbi:MAG: extracellular solute-binding protein [Phycisphaerales bacterium]